MRKMWNLEAEYPLYEQKVRMPFACAEGAQNGASCVYEAGETVRQGEWALRVNGP